MRKWRNKITGEIYRIYPALQIVLRKVKTSDLESYDDKITTVVPSEKEIRVVIPDKTKILKNDNRNTEEQK